MIRRTIGEWVAWPGHLVQGEATYLAQVLEVTARTLFDWADYVTGKPREAVGRRPHSVDERCRVLRLVIAEIRRLGKRTTWRAVRDSLCAQAKADQAFDAPEKLVHELACKAKRHLKGMLRIRRDARRVHVEVLVKDGVWAGDGTKLGRDENDRAVVAEHVVDVGTSETVDASAGPPLRSQDVIDALDRGHAARGTDPLVVMTDNGPENSAPKTRDHLAERKIVHLLNLPYTPEHNAHNERAHRDLKAVLGIEPKTPGLVLGGDVWTARVAEAVHYLDCDLRRERLGGLTAKEYGRTVPCWYDLVDRDRFYDATCKAVEAAVQGIEDARDRRMAEREAKLTTMETFGLIKRTRGGARLPNKKSEVFS